MKVNIEGQCLCTTDLRGIPYYTINLMEALAKRNQNDYAVSFFDYNQERNNRAYIEQYLKNALQNGLRIKESNTLNYKLVMEGSITGNTSQYDKRFYHEYFEEKFDVYHFPHTFSMPQNVRETMVVTVHDTLPVMPEYYDGWNQLTNLQFKNSLEYIKGKKDIQIISDSMHTKKDIVERIGISEDRIHVIPLAYNKQLHYTDKNKEVLIEMGIDKPYILYLGVLDFRKGIADILDAFEIVKRKNKDITLVLAGKYDANVKAIAERLENHKYIEDIILTGFVNDEQKRGLMSCAEAFLFPSEYEGFGLPVLEAMACGSPVITTNVSSLPEVGGDAAMYVSPKQPEELAAAIEKMLSSESLRQDYIARGFEQCKKFSWDKTAEMTEELYKLAYERR